MNQLDPDLKRLMNWSQCAPSSPADCQVPAGFAARVAARTNLQSLGSESQDLQFLGWTVGLASLVIICGLLVIQHNTRAPMPMELDSAVQFAINQLSP